jgi:hypothetical protein
MYYFSLFLLFLIFPGNDSIYSKAGNDEDCKVLMSQIADNYIGECRRGLAHGYGIATGEDFYQGQFRKGLPHGMGKYTWGNGDTYDGPWRKGEMHGYGEFTIAESDSSFYGLWMRDEFKRIIDTTAVDVPDYRIFYRRNLTNVRFRRTGDGDKVLFNVRDAGAGRRTMNMNLFGTSGKDIAYGSHFGFENVEFPFEGKISFTAPSRSGVVFYQIELHFEINQPGLWEIYLNF